jgi:hypothetical protein
MKLPPGGWQYTQLDNDGKTVRNRWVNGMSSFGEFVREVTAFRAANGYAGADMPTVAAAVGDATCARLNDDPRFCAQKKTETPARFFKEPVAAIQQAVVRAVAAATRLNEGRKILGEWLGEGAVPVSRDEAGRRADICRGCPANDAGFKPVEAVAEAILRHVESKSSLKLQVPNESELHTCSACWCHLPLKVWVPAEFLKPKPEVETALRGANPNCWQLQTPA